MALTATATGFDSGTINGDWRARAACRPSTGVDPEIMWPLPTAGASIAAARAVCSGCDVKIACLQQGVDEDEWESIRGGLTGKERIKYHHGGLTPEQYPLPGTPQRMCLGCGKVYRLNGRRHRSRTLCEQCHKRCRGDERLGTVLADYRQLKSTGLTRTQIAHRLGFTTRQGLTDALRRAERAGMAGVPR